MRTNNFVNNIVNDFVNNFIQKKCSALILMSAFTASNLVFAQTPADILQGYATHAAITVDKFSDQRGKVFYSTKGKDWSCATCHTANPKDNGLHAATNRTIQPLAPSANPERLTDPKKVEKWFKRNCQEVHNRECTVQEKGDFIQYLLSVR